MRHQLTRTQKHILVVTMVNSIATATVTDHGGATTERDINVEDDKKAVELLSHQGSSPFQVGEKVLALFDQHLYKAKVQKIDFQIDKWAYFVHYLGWKKSWDEWVGVEWLFKYTEENLQKQQELKQKHESYNNANAGGAVQLKPNAYIGSKLLDGLSLSGSRCKKRRIHSVQVEKFSLIEKHSNINIPPALKTLLIEDYESRIRLGKLVKLPRSPTVREILFKYHEYRLKEGLLSVSFEEIVKGLCCYFDKALHAMLLYKNERQQYKEAIVGDLTPSAVYGAEHLLRLIVKLPELLHRANIEENMLTELHLTLADFLKFFEKCQTDFYPPAYRSGSGEVHDAISISEEDK